MARVPPPVRDGDHPGRRPPGRFEIGGEVDGAIGHGAAGALPNDVVERPADEAEIAGEAGVAADVPHREPADHVAAEGVPGLHVEVDAVGGEAEMELAIEELETVADEQALDVHVEIGRDAAQCRLAEGLARPGFLRIAGRERGEAQPERGDPAEVELIEREAAEFDPEAAVRAFAEADGTARPGARRRRRSATGRRRQDRCSSPCRKSRWGGPPPTPGTSRPVRRTIGARSGESMPKLPVNAGGAPSAMTTSPAARSASSPKLPPNSVASPCSGMPLAVRRNWAPPSTATSDFSISSWRAMPTAS